MDACLPACPQDVRACAWAPGPQGRVYTFATATVDADIVLWTLDPYAGMLTGQKVGSFCGGGERLWRCG